MKIHNSNDSTTLSYNEKGDSTIQFTNHFTGDATASQSYMKGSYLGIRGTTSQSG